MCARRTTSVVTAEAEVNHLPLLLYNSLYFIEKHTIKEFPDLKEVIIPDKKEKLISEKTSADNKCKH